MIDVGSLHSHYTFYLHMYEIFYHKMLKGRDGNITKKTQKHSINRQILYHYTPGKSNTGVSKLIITIQIKEKGSTMLLG